MPVRYSLRTLARDRGFAAVAILTLALGIGANTAIFSLINGVLLQSVPFAHPEQLVTIAERIPKLAGQMPSLPVNGRHLFEWRKQSKSLEQISALDSRRMTLTGAGEPEQIGTALVTASLFPMLGVQPRLGRAFLDEEDRPGKNRVVILADSLWRRRFSADPAIVGRSILLDGAPHIVVGVLSPDFHFFANHDLDRIASLEPRSEIFRPLGINIEDIGLMGEFNYMAIARLKPGITREQAVAELNVVQAAIVSQLGPAERTELQVLITPLQEQITGQSRKGLMVLLAAVGAVLLIVCVNLANLMLARGLARSRESSIRTALGATRGDLILQSLTEALVLSSSGGVLGVAAAAWGVRILIQNAPVELPRLDTVNVDGMVLAFGLAITLLTGLLFGILPALKIASSEPADALRGGGRAATESVQGLQLRGILVASEVALSTILLIAAGLLLNSFVRVMRVDQGFDRATVMATDVMLPAAKYADEAQRERFYDRLLERLRSIPTVRSAGLVSVLPLEGEGWADVVTLDGEHHSMMERPIANYRFVSPGYFSAMGIPLAKGRSIENSDRMLMPAVVSETLAKRLFPGQNPLGRSFRRGDETERPFEIVGVVRDVRTASLEQTPGMVVYVPFWFRNRMKFTLVARTLGKPGTIAPSIRSVVRDLDSDIPLSEMRTMDQVVARSVAPRRFQLTLVLLFAGTALFLASLGIYGVVSYLITQRRVEIGIRRALGAQNSDVYSLTLGQGLRPVIGGLAVGLIGAFGISRLLSSLLFQVSEHDPTTFAIVSGSLLAIATIACWVPSRRALTADPSAILRND